MTYANKHTCCLCRKDKPVAYGDWHVVDNLNRWICHRCFLKLIVT